MGNYDEIQKEFADRVLGGAKAAADKAKEQLEGAGATVTLK